LPPNSPKGFVFQLRPSANFGLVRDLAALNGCAVLPWGVWGAQPPAAATLSAEELDFFDGIARLTADPDVNFDALRLRFAADTRVRLTANVFKALHQREERVLVD